MDIYLIIDKYLIKVEKVKIKCRDSEDKKYNLWQLLLLILFDE